MWIFAKNPAKLSHLHSHTCAKVSPPPEPPHPPCLPHYIKSTLPALVLNVSTSMDRSNITSSLLFYYGIYCVNGDVFVLLCDFLVALIVSVAVLSSDVSAPADYHQSLFNPDSYRVRHSDTCSMCAPRSNYHTVQLLVCREKMAFAFVVAATRPHHSSP